MNIPLSRRSFLSYAGALAATTAVPCSFAASAKGKAQLQFGYTAMTWGNEERQAVDDISALGYPGIQFRANAVTDFKVDELKQLLAEKKLTFVALSSGELNIDPAVEADQMALHLGNAKFLKETGGMYLQILDQLKPYPRTVTPDECTRLGKLLTELGKRTSDLGIKIGYHNHMNTISEHPDNLERVLDAADPKYVHLELDTAHYVAGGGDPAKAILKHHENLLFMHLKDVADIPMSTPGAKYPFKFVELGQGRVDLPAVFAALDQVQYKGWGVVELDRVPDTNKTPKQCAATSKAYLEQKIGVKV
jgi:inosose dehydratase